MLIDWIFSINRIEIWNKNEISIVYMGYSKVKMNLSRLVIRC